MGKGDFDLLKFKIAMAKLKVSELEKIDDILEPRFTHNFGTLVSYLYEIGKRAEERGV